MTHNNHDLINMFLAGVEWERRRDDKPAIKVAINQAMSQIRVAEQRDGADLAQHTCPSCNGEGIIRRPFGYLPQRCEACKGTGQV